MKPTSSKTCCVPICRALNLRNNKLIPFPKGKKKAKRWAEALGIREEQTKDAYVCVLHFRQRDFINSKDSNVKKNKLHLEKTALPSRNLKNYAAAASNLKSCYVKISPLPVHRLTKIEPPKEVKNKLLSFITNKTLVKNNKNGQDFRNVMNPKSKQLINKKIKTYTKLAEDRDKINIINGLKTLQENSTQLESSKISGYNKVLLKNSSKVTTNSKNIKKKVRIKTKLGQFMPKVTKRVVLRDQIVTNKEVIEYEVIEKIDDCNVLILRM